MVKHTDWSRIIGAVTVTNITGWVKSYPSLDAAIRAIGRGNVDRLKYGHLGYHADFDLYPYRDRKPGQRDCSWLACHRGDAYVFRDELGLVVPVWRVRETAQHVGYDDFAARWRRLRRPHVFRQGPVPLTRCSRGGRSYFRDVHTLPERRANEALDQHDDIAELGVKLRGRRQKLPTDYDDLPYSRRGRGWKLQRATQYKTKEM